MQMSQFDVFLNDFTGKTYIPIISFPRDLNNEKRNAISTIVEKMVINQSDIKSNVEQGLKIIITEILDNITEHSESPFLYIFAQAYPQNGYLDVCIADQGIGLLGSYKKVPDNEIKDDLEAMKSANNRISSKDRPKAESLGFGIWSSKQMLLRGLGGQYLMASGNSYYFEDSNLVPIIRNDGNLRLNGTLVALRIPTTPILDFDYRKFIE